LSTGCADRKHWIGLIDRFMAGTERTLVRRKAEVIRTGREEWASSETGVVRLGVGRYDTECIAMALSLAN